MIGGGKLYVFDDNQGQFALAAAFDSGDSLFDCVWSESSSNHLLTAHGGGGVRLWDVSSKGPPRIYAEHAAEVYAVDWNLISKDVFVSGAWDKTVKVSLLDILFFFESFLLSLLFQFEFPLKGCQTYFFSSN